MIPTVRAGYEKVACLPCEGSGRVKKGAPGGFYSWKSDRRRRPACSACGGFGFNAVRTVGKK